jgi:hypothetical protein
MFESGDGKTSLYLNNSTAAINLGDSKASLAYINRINTRAFSWGVGAYATSNSGVTALFSSEKAKAPEGGGSVVFAEHLGLKRQQNNVGNPFPEREGIVLLDVGYGRSSFYLYPANLIPSTSTRKTDFNRFRTITAVNYYYGGQYFFGIAAGAERRNNLSDLKSTNLQTVVVPGTPNSIVSAQAGYYGSYKQYVAAPIYTDFLIYLPKKIAVPGFDNRVGFDLISRSDLASPNRGSSGGIGIFLFKEGKQQEGSPIGGVTATFDGTKFVLSLTTGFTSSSK